MTESYEIFRALLETHEDFSAIADDELDRIRERAKADLIKVLRNAIDEIGRSPDQGRGLDAFGAGRMNARKLPPLAEAAILGAIAAGRGRGPIGSGASPCRPLCGRPYDSRRA